MTGTKIIRKPIDGTTRVSMKCTACRAVAVFDREKVDVDAEVARHEANCSKRPAPKPRKRKVPVS